jgi:hypothetical protein
MSPFLAMVKMATPSLYFASADAPAAAATAETCAENSILFFLNLSSCSLVSKKNYFAVSLPARLETNGYLRHFC